MRLYSQLRCPNVIYEELESFMCSTNYFFLTYEEKHNIKIKKLNVNNSFETVIKYVEEHGGNIVYGTSILESDIIFEAEAFAIWESPEKTFHHITDKYNKQILFIPNENPYKIPFDVKSRFNNLFFTEKKKYILNFIKCKMYYQSFVDKIDNSLTKEECETVKHYQDLTALEYYTNREIENDSDFKIKMIRRNSR